MAAGIHHAPPLESAGASPGVAAFEALLARWFEAEVVLTSSGRAALLLWLTHVGLNRYRHRIALPRMMAACVFDAVIRRGFPVDVVEKTEADATIFYHQYGFTQTGRPRGARIVEDLCHGFFATPSSGAREFAGEAAIFSLPKFFGVRMMAGGVLTRDRALARDLRARRDSFPIPSVATRARQARAWHAEGKTGGPALEIVYLERLGNPRVADADLAGAPTTLRSMASIGAARRRVADALLASIPPASWPPGWREMLATTLPFAFPVFGPPARLAGADAALARLSVQAGLYQLDVARDQYAPDWRTALLLPCHHRISRGFLTRIREIVGKEWPE